MTFEEGQVVYVVKGAWRDDVTRGVVERATKTAVVVKVGGSEARFNRETGQPIPRGQGYYTPRLHAETHEMRMRYLESTRVRVAQRIQAAATDFVRANPRDRKREPIDQAIGDWLAVNTAIDNARRNERGA